MKILLCGMVNKKGNDVVLQRRERSFQDEPKGNNSAGANQRKHGQRFDSRLDGNHHCGHLLAGLCCKLGNGTSCIRSNHLHCLGVRCPSCKIQHRVPTQQAKRDQEILHAWPVVDCPCFLCCHGPVVPISVICQPNTLGNHYPHIGNRPLLRSGGSFAVQRKKLGPQRRILWRTRTCVVLIGAWP